MTVAWVVGSGGLLGSALLSALRRGGAGLFSPVERFCWARESEIASQIATAVQGFAERAAAADRWEIYWAAGVGTMSSSESALAAETQIFSTLLRCLGSTPSLIAAHGAIAYASSAGAIYAGATDSIITEITPPAPTTAYARAKFEQEEMIRSFAQKNAKVSALLARLSTLYGPGQAHGKKQGLLSHIARCLLVNLPVQIYVPFDTIRDYIFSDDAAAAMIAALRATAETSRIQLKIIASERPVTIAEIIATFKRVARRAPRVIMTASRLSIVYLRRVRFRSAIAPESLSLPATTLLIGIARLMAAERTALMRGWRTGIGSSTKPGT